MPYHDNTSRFRPRSHKTIFSEPEAASRRLHSQTLRFEIIGLFRTEVGPEWDSQGKEESDHFHHVDLVVGGEALVRHGSSQLTLQRGLAYFFPGATPLIRECRQRYETLWLRFRCCWLSGFDPLLQWPERTPLCLGPWDEQEWCVSLRGNALPDTQALMRWQSRLIRWFADALPNVDAIIGEQAQAHEQFQSVFELIDNRLHANLRVDDLAQAYRSSVQTFSRDFSKTFGQAPKAYLRSRLNQRAIALIMGSHATMKEIANQLRFSDEYYFSRFFTQLNGRSPARYRRSMREQYACGHGAGEPADAQ